MKKYVKIIIGIIIVVLVIVGLVFLKHENVKETVNKDIVQSKEVKDALNTIKKEASNVKNEVKNVVEEPKVDEETSKEETEKEDNKKNEISNDEKAIDMVKQDWGADNNVTFKIDEVSENGKYVIGVVDKKTTKVLMWYDVDVNNNTLQEKY